MSQTTSSVNCIAIKGMSNRSAVMSATLMTGWYVFVFMLCYNWGGGVEVAWENIYQTSNVIAIRVLWYWKRAPSRTYLPGAL